MHVAFVKEFLESQNQLKPAFVCCISKLEMAQSLINLIFFWHNADAGSERF